MPTPMESNTLGLQEVLRAVNALPTAEGGGGGSVGIPLIDLIELGFPDVDGLGYNEVVLFDRTTWETLKVMIEYGVVKIKMRQPNGTIGIETFLCTIYDDGNGTQYRAEKTIGTWLFSFGISPENMTEYGASFYVAGS